jgi:hypothetical protein
MQPKNQQDAQAVIARLQSENERLREAIRQEAIQLRAWAAQSRSYGWSTHQVEPMRRRADLLDEVLAKTQDL